MNPVRVKDMLYVLLMVISFQSLTAQVTVEKRKDNWTLLVEGNPFEIKGVTFGYDKDVSNYDKHFRDLKYLGVNTIRTWGTDENTDQLLDAANAHGIKVMLGIWMRHGRAGMEADDSFDYLNDADGKEDMYVQAIEVVQKYKDHPAVLMWGIGNEVYLNTSTDEEKIAYSKLLERICAQIQLIDSDHPVVSVGAWTFGAEWWSTYVPSIDIYGINTYGAGANILPEELAKKGIDKPYVITEFGVRGEWEIEKDKNGVKPEPSDEEKYEVIVKGYKEWIRPKPSCLGVYIFHFANDNRHIGPWLLSHFQGMTRPQYWAIREAYTDMSPDNNVPKIKSFQLPDAPTNSEEWIPVVLEVEDAEKEKLEARFYYNQRTGSRKRRDQLVEMNIKGNFSEGFKIQLPKVNGGIKVYATVSDSFQNVGIATTSISVIDEEEAKRKFLVPRVQLPFYVYDDNNDLPYVPSAFMGNFEHIDLDLNHTETVKSGESAIKISYKSNKGWYGVGFVDPANDWGDILGGYDIRGAKKFSFWAKASYDNIDVEVGFGLIEEGDKSYLDTAKKLKKLSLTDDWKKYTIKIKKMDLSCIRSGFVIFSSSQGVSHDIYIDEIVFE